MRRAHFIKTKTAIDLNPVDDQSALCKQTLTRAPSLKLVLSFGVILGRHSPMAPQHHLH